jgi:hypothetical protein
LCLKQGFEVDDLKSNIPDENRGWGTGGQKIKQEF